nr:MobA/MobL family protein [Streptococcus suis]
MAIYHLHKDYLKRQRQKCSSLASSKWRKDKNEYDGIVHDFTRKGGIAHTELPQNSTTGIFRQGTLWNSVEKIKRVKLTACKRNRNCFT